MGYIKNIDISGYGVGSIVKTNSASAPFGCLTCDGSSQLRSAFPLLFAKIGTSCGTADSLHFNLPDHRGMFLRGADPTNVNDTGPRQQPLPGGNLSGVGTTQLDTFQGHKHTSVALIDTSAVNQGAFAGQGNDGRTQLQNLMDGGYDTDGTNGVPRAWLETRPKNAAVLICIVYK
jgi:microcystin-dependent protein